MVGQVLGQAVQRRLVEIEQHQARAGLGEAHRQRPADAGAATGDQHHLAVEHLVAKYLADDSAHGALLA
ncbi:hypothetical protein D3C81_1949850 [compost metagenome]